MPHVRGITVVEIENYLEELEQNDEDVADVEVVIIPPDVDEVTDEEDIQENELIQTTMYDVAGTLEVFHSSKEVEEIISTTEGHMESEDIFPTCSSENILCRKKKRCQTAEQSAIQNNTPLAETEQLQKAATNQWKKCQPEYQIENNTTNKIVQLPDILDGKVLLIFLKNLCVKK
jgi:hypothetical protein